MFCLLDLDASYSILLHGKKVGITSITTVLSSLPHRNRTKKFLQGPPLSLDKNMFFVLCISGITAILKEIKCV